MKVLRTANRRWLMYAIVIATVLGALTTGFSMNRATGPMRVAIGPVAQLTVDTPFTGEADAQLASEAAQATCQHSETRRVADVRVTGLPEASALVASQQWPGVYWTLNDHGNDATLIAFDEQGRSRGTFRVNQAKNVDWEALQLGLGRDGTPALYIGDVGDNTASRRDAVIYRVPEPQPATPGSSTPVSSAGPVETFRVVYPDGPHNTEAVLVHPITGEIVLVTKDTSGQSTVFRLPLPLNATKTVTLERTAGLDLRMLGPQGSLVTDAAVSPDAHQLVLRTYTRVLEFDLQDGSSLSSVWGQSPRISLLNDGPKGEGITYRVDALNLMTIGEGSPATLYETRRAC